MSPPVPLAVAPPLHAARVPLAYFAFLSDIQLANANLGLTAAPSNLHAERDSSTGEERAIDIEREMKNQDNMRSTLLYLTSGGFIRFSR